MKKSDQYLKIVEWSEEDGCYIGTAPGLIYGGVHGENEVEVYKELIQAVEDSIEIFIKDGKPLPPPTIPGLYKKDHNINQPIKIINQYA